MAAGSGISWCDATFNPLIGCTKVSAGCKNCYAERDFDRRKGFAEWGNDGSRVMTSRSNWNHLLKWDRMAAAGGCLGCLKYPPESGRCETCGGTGQLNRRQTVFVASLADVCEDWDGPIYGRNRKLFPDDGPLVFEGVEAGGAPNWDSVWDEFALNGMVGRRVTYNDVRDRLWSYIERCPNLIFLVLTKRPQNILRMTEGRYFPNVMFGTSIEDQRWAHERLPHLHAARVRCGSGLFVSCEPLLGPVDLGLDGPERQQLDWVITGGESGPDARPARSDWYRSIRDQCLEYGGVPFHFKQLDAATYGKLATKWDSFPDDLKVRELPSCAYNGPRKTCGVQTTLAGSTKGGWGQRAVTGRIPESLSSEDEGPGGEAEYPGADA